jgi:hypothetical protein
MTNLPLAVPPPGHPRPGDPSPEEVRKAMVDNGFDDYLKALQFLLINAGDPEAIDAPDA